MKSAIEAKKPLTAMYVGGMGSATHNYHREAMVRRGFPEAAARIHELWMAGRKDEAVAAVPDEYVEEHGTHRHRAADSRRVGRASRSWA